VENITTYSHAWIYPGQEDRRKMVSLAKIGACYPLTIISFALVEWVHGRCGNG